MLIADCRLLIDLNAAAPTADSVWRLPQLAISNQKSAIRWALPRPGEPAAHVRICLALLPSGPDAVRRLRLHRVRAAVRPPRPDVPDDRHLLSVLHRVWDPEDAIALRGEETDHRLTMARFG